eukprot:COSAG01_NODE_5176_length_4432_cov_5.631202_2_plen_605_part_00
MRDSFRRECETLRGLRHPNIVEFLGVVVGASSGEWLYLATPFFEDGTLRDVLYAPRHAGLRVQPSLLPRSLLPLNTQLVAAEGMFSALAYLAERRLMHRDIKPANLLVVVDRGGGEGEGAQDGVRSGLSLQRVVVCDLGESNQITPAMSTQARAQTRAGTPIYCAPEMFDDCADKGPCADVFSAGVVLIEQAVGSVPSPTSMHRHGAVVPENRRRADDLGQMEELQPQLARLARRCISDEQHLRPAAAEAARECMELRRQLAQLQLDQHQQPSPLQGQPWDAEMARTQSAEDRMLRAALSASMQPFPEGIPPGRAPVVTAAALGSAPPAYSAARAGGDASGVAAEDPVARLQRKVAEHRATADTIRSMGQDASLVDVQVADEQRQLDALLLQRRRWQQQHHGHGHGHHHHHPPPQPQPLGAWASSSPVVAAVPSAPPAVAMAWVVDDDVTGSEAGAGPSSQRSTSAMAGQPRNPATTRSPRPSPTLTAAAAASQAAVAAMWGVDAGDGAHTPSPSNMASSSGDSGAGGGQRRQKLKKVISAPIPKALTPRQLKAGGDRKSSTAAGAGATATAVMGQHQHAPEVLARVRPECVVREAALTGIPPI